MTRSMTLQQNLIRLTEALEKIIIQPKKTDVLQRYFGFLWVPFFHSDNGTVKSLNRLIS